MKVVFFGTPDFALTALRAVLESRHEVVATVCQPDRPGGRGLKTLKPPVGSLCESRGVSVLQPKKLRFSEMESLFRTTGAKIGVVVAYGKILSGKILDLPGEGFVNVHASILPRHRGASPVSAAIIAGDARTGVSIMKLDEGMDTGPLFRVVETPIDPMETAGELSARLAQLGARTLVEVLDSIEEGKAVAVPQSGDHSLAPLLTKDDGMIDWSAPARRIHDLVRGVNPWPGAFCGFRGGRVNIWRTEVSPSGAGRPGEVIQVGKDLLRVAAGAGAVDVLEIQAPGKKRLGPGDFINGARVSAGDLFGAPERKGI